MKKNQYIKIAIVDWAEAAKRWYLSYQLALEDLRDRYRRSFIGIAWIAITFLTFIGVKALVFGYLNSMPIREFTEYLTIGFAFWVLASALVVDGASTYITARAWILSSSLSYAIYILQGVFRSFINFGLVALAAFVVLLFTSQGINSTAVAVIPALFIYFITGLWVATLLAPVAAHYRDFNFALQTGMRILFFATPVLWVPQSGTTLETIAMINPFTHYLEIIRQPLLGKSAPVLSWIVVAILTVIGPIAAAIVYSKTRHKIAYWV